MSREIEQESFHHMCHEHPLSLIPDSSEKIHRIYKCLGCWRYFSPGEVAYGCISKLCIYGARNEKHSHVEHPSHPEHQLRFSKKTRWCPFPCDACGATEKGDSYTCTVCDYSIHQSCALLPLSKDIPHHHHSLSLAFSLPYEYIPYEFDCAICSLTLPLRRWVYHCKLCRYVVHLNCATSTFDDENENGNANAIDDAKVVTKFPKTEDDIYEEMIRPFVKRQRGKLDIIPPHDHDNHNIGGKYSFSNHPHLLTFTTFSLASSSSSSSSHYHCKIDDDDDDDDDDGIPRSEIICDGCTLAIHEKKEANDDEYESGYMSCDECKYFLHLSCFDSPLEIPSLPIHLLNDHNLRLQNVDGKLTNWIFCIICYAYTNGLYYVCTNKECWFRIDIKCASLPNTIKHAAHPRHNYLNFVKGDNSSFCYKCRGLISNESGEYRCDSCRFRVCAKCVMLPATNKHRLENHLLSLTYEAYVNRPGDFYCSSCEHLMHPRLWMYYCRDCDQSFDPECFPATSGRYRNIKYGTKQYVISIHDHPLRFQIISNKKRCDQCHEDSYDEPGFQCASCFFAVCVECGLKCLGDA